MHMNDVRGSGRAMVSLSKIKCRICEANVAPYVAVRQQNMILSPLNDALDNSIRENKNGKTLLAVSGSAGIARYILPSFLLNKDRIRWRHC